MIAESLTVLAVATMLTGKPDVQVDPSLFACPTYTWGQAYGCADLDSHTMFIRPDLAAMLPKLEETQPYQAALAVLVFAHESAHLTDADPTGGPVDRLVRGQTDEVAVERQAVRNAPRAARLLGASAGWVARMRPWVKYWDRKVGL